MRRWLLPVALVLEIILFSRISGSGSASSGAYWIGYAGDLIRQSAPLMVLGFAMTLVLMTGGIDLSVASMTALAACIMSSFDAGSSFWWTAVPAGLLAGLLLGVVNGMLVARMDVPPIVATLGSMILFRGFCFVVMGTRERGPFLEVPGYEFLGSWAGVICFLALLFGGIAFWFQNSRWRRELLMLGGNRIAARYAAIPVFRRTFEIYALSGAAAFLAAILLTSRNGSMSASSFSGMELQVIVAVVLGGTRVQGGAGSLWGTFWGVLLVAVLDEGLRSSSLWGEKHLPFKISHLEFVLLGALLLFCSLAASGRATAKRVE